MKLTRRDFLKGGAITALALAVGVKPKPTGGYITEMPPVYSQGFVFPDPEKWATGIRRQSAMMLDNCGVKLVPILNVSPELVQAEADWHEWRQELHHALATGLVAEMDAAFLHGDPT